jgi:hypothetical protein
MRKFGVVIAYLSGLALMAGAANAGTYRCEGGARVLPSGKCSDGSMAIYQATPISPDRPAEHGYSHDRRDRGDISTFFGAWSTVVPGAVWQSPSNIPGWDTLHISPGAIDGLLVIYPNGRYVWNAYGGKRGSWRASGNGDYPILLDDRAEHRIWKVGVNDRKANAIYIVESNGYFYYEGRRAR